MLANGPSVKFCVQSDYHVLHNVVVCQMHVWIYVFAILMALTPRKKVFTIAIFKAMLNPVINFTVFGEIIYFGTPFLQLKVDYCSSLQF